MSLIHPNRTEIQQPLGPSRMLSAKRSIVEHGIESRIRGTLGWLKIRRTSSTAFNRKGQLPWVGYRVFRYGSSASRRADHTRRNGTPGPNALRISTDTLYSRHGATICLCLRIKGAFTACNSLTSKAIHPGGRLPPIKAGSMPFSLLVSTSFRLGALALNFFYALVFHSPRIGKASEIIHRFGKQLVVGRVASITGQMANQAGLHQLLRRTARRIQKAPRIYSPQIFAIHSQPKRNGAQHRYPSGLHGIAPGWRL